MRGNSDQIGLLQTLAFPVDLSNLKVLGKDNGVQDDARLESEGHAGASLDSKRLGGRTNSCANNLFDTQESASYQTLQFLGDTGRATGNRVRSCKNSNTVSDVTSKPPSW